MKKASFFLSLLFVLCTQAVLSQSFEKTPQGIKANVNDIDIELQVFSNRIVRVIKTPAGTAFSKQSLSVIKTPETLSLDISRMDNQAVIRLDNFQASLDLHTGRVWFSQGAGKTVLSEKDYGTQFNVVQDVDRNTYNVRQAFLLDKDEQIYGLGQLQNGRLSQRGQKVHLQQENMKVAIPFFQSAKGYGVFWDNYSPTTFTDNPQETSFDSEIGDCSDYYVLLGGCADSVIACMRELTGQAPMMPLWLYGFSQSRERYKTQYELVDAVKRYRALKVPLDGIIQDWQYWGADSVWNAMSFNPVTFPEPKKMVDSVHQLNAHLFIVAWPGFGPKTKQYQEFKAKKMLIDFETFPPNNNTTQPYDPYNPAARDIYWSYLNKGLFSLDVDAWWLDSSEPDHMNYKDSDLNLPTYLGSYRKVRNAFPLQHVGGIYDHQRRTSEIKRVNILTRSAFAGQQRYGANTWSGDVNSDWKTFRTQIPAGLNFSLCGIPYWNTDIGGFWAGAYNEGGGAKNPEFQELYTRWMQFATFTPMMRSHGTGVPREIYQFGQPGDRIFDVQSSFINLRYRLLPYSYATARNVTAHAGSIIRALFMDFASDPKVVNIDNEFLYGRSFLVSPVTEKGASQQAVYLPAGADWFDFWTGEKLQGGLTLNRATPIEIVPLYVRAGSIVPWGPAVQYAEEKKWDNLEIRVYPGADDSFTLYEDENNSYNYEKGLYSEISFHWNDQARTLTIGNRKGSFPGMLANRKFRVVVVDQQHGAGVDAATKVDKTVLYKGREVVVALK